MSVESLRYLLLVIIVKINCVDAQGQCAFYQSSFNCYNLIKIKAIIRKLFARPLTNVE